MYIGVPITSPGRVIASVAMCATPKSSSLGTSPAKALRARKMFCGLMSRWMMPSRCTLSRTSSTSTIVRVATGGSNAPRARR